MCDCVEVPIGDGTTGIPDSKATPGPVLAFTTDAFAAFLSEVKGSGT
ncbi:DUF397 domain-containing protein [Streptomyces sp. NPDC005407]